MRTRHLLAPVAALLFGLLLALPGGALAAKPTFHDKIDDTVADTPCGVSGTWHVTGTQVGWFEPGVGFQVSGQVNQVFTADDGRVAIVKVAGTTKGSYTDNGDGTATVVNSYRGLPESIRGATGGPVSRDAGNLTITTTFVIATGELVSQSVVEHGPHPEADAGFALFCDAFLQALG